MTALTAKQLSWLRQQVGTVPADSVLQEKFDLYESVRDVAIDVLRERRQELLDAPLSATLQGVGGANSTENVKAIERDLALLVKLDDDPTDEPGEEAQAASGYRFDEVQLVRGRRR